MRLLSRLAVAAGLAASFGLSAAETPRTALLVLSKGDHVLSIVDPVTLKIVAQAPSGPDPHEVIASADGRFAYISNYGGGALHTITVVDLQAQKNLPVIELGPLGGPHGLVFEDGKLWFTAEGAKVIGSYDPQTGKIDFVLGTGQNRTHMLYVFPGAQQIITSNIASATLTLIEKTTGGPGGGGPPPSRRVDWNETVVKVGRGVEGFDVAPGGKWLWAANSQDGTISVVDLTTKTVTVTLDANVRSANRLKFTPDGKLVLVSMLGGPDLAVFDASTQKEVKRIPLGHGAAGIQMDPSGTRAFVACTPDNYVAIIDLKSLTVTGHLDAGKQPDGMAWTGTPLHR